MSGDIENWSRSHTKPGPIAEPETTADRFGQLLRRYEVPIDQQCDAPQPYTLARKTVGQGVYNVSTNNLGVMMHHSQECQILTVDRDAQALEVLGYGEAGYQLDLLLHLWRSCRNLPAGPLPAALRHLR